MPGIAGIIGDIAPAEQRRQVAAMIDSMRHDPSYVGDIHSQPDSNACFGWVAHPESFAARRSGSSPDGVTLALCGECIPSVDRSGELTDLLGQYRQAGPSFVTGLNGLFSAVLADSRRRLVLLFNDRYGGERIYFHLKDDRLYFASEAKAILTVIPELRALDEEGVAQFLAYGSTRPGVTLFREIRLLPGGSLWVFERGERPVHGKYFEPIEWEAQDELTANDFEAAFVDTARAVIPEYSNSDSPVGISITGGLDTRMIMACLPPGAKPVCYTYGAPAGDTLDVRIARRVARGMELEHHTLRVHSEFVANFSSYVDRTVFVTDGCLGALGAHELFFSALARNLAPVRLTGNFGSEVLRSMTTLKPLELAPGLLNPAAQARVRMSYSTNHAGHPLTRTVFDEVPFHLYGPVAAARSQLTFRTPYLDNALVKLAYRAPSEALRSPAASLRLISTGPDLLARIATDRGRSCGRVSMFSALRRLFCELTFKLDYLDKEGLQPQLSAFDTYSGIFDGIGLLGLHKFLPYRGWFRRELAVYIADVLGSSSARQQPWWDNNFLAKMGSDHARGRQNYLREINAVLTLEAIERVLVRGLPRTAVERAATTEAATR